MTSHDDLTRSKLLAERIRQRTDERVRRLVDEFTGRLCYLDAREELLISQPAWEYVTTSGIEPRRVFAHPDLLQEHPEASFYYRGIALLSLKRVRAAAGVDVKGWESKARVRPVSQKDARRVCRVYNSVISSIIEGTTEWSLGNGYRNILNTMGITLDGMFRNVIGQDAEKLIKTRIADWLDEHVLILERKSAGRFDLPNGVTMVFGSEPDILFSRAEDVVATIEIKGGKDPAGALERLGAMQKSFAETPPRCQNFLIAGVVTTEMEARLAQHNVRVFVLDDLLNDAVWNAFTTELFHHALRIT